jgi:hypothetical protein
MVFDPSAERNRLLKALDDRTKAVKDADDWFEGRHPTPEPPINTAAAVDGEARAAFNNMSALSVTNLLPPIVTAPARKLDPQGFQLSQEPSKTDGDAWTIWLRNDMDAEAGVIADDALRTGQSIVLVWPGKDGKAVITVEDPAQCIVAYTAGSRKVRRSALKRWIDDDGYTCVTLYTPAWIYKWRSKSKQVAGLHLPGGESWEQRDTPGESWPLRNPYGEVTMCEIAVGRGSKARPFGGGTPYFTGQLNEQRKINQTVMNLLVTMEYQAFRQRWVTGWDFPLLEDGTPDKAAIAKASAARVMAFSADDPQAADQIRVGEFAQADFTPFGKMMEVWIKVMASTSSTPPYAFLLGDMVNVAADALARIDGEHIASVEYLSRFIGRGEAEVLRLCYLVEGNPKANDPVITTVWGEFENRTGSEQADMAKTLDDVGAPKEAVFGAFKSVDAYQANQWANRNRGQQLLAAAAARSTGA